MDIAALRAQTPGCARRTHLNNAGAALMTTATLAAMTDHLRREALIGGYEAAAEATDRIADTYAALAELVGGELVDERTKLIGLTWVPTSGGLVNPAAAVGRIARETGALYLLDATQAVGQFPIDVDELGCDLLTGTGRKFLRAPRGTGFLWARSAVLDRLDPFVVEIRSATWDGGRGFEWAEGARRFETWENSYVNVLGLGSAVRQALDLGMADIGRRTHALGERLRAGLDGVDGVRTHDLGEQQCAIVTAADVAAALGAAGINVSTTVPEHNQLDTETRGVHPLVRFSPHYYNTEEELDRCIAAVELLVPLRAG